MQETTDIRWAQKPFHVVSDISGITGVWTLEQMKMAQKYPG